MECWSSDRIHKEVKQIHAAKTRTFLKKLFRQQEQKNKEIQTLQARVEREKEKKLLMRVTAL
jgi:hypothetical protein